METVDSCRRRTCPQFPQPYDDGPLPNGPSAQPESHNKHSLNWYILWGKLPYHNNKGQIDLDAAKRICRDREIGLCDHGETGSEPFGTIYSWVAELGTGEIHVAHGRPCQNAYQVMALEVS